MSLSKIVFNFVCQLNFTFYLTFSASHFPWNKRLLTITWPSPLSLLKIFFVCQFEIYWQQSLAKANQKKNRAKTWITNWQLISRSPTTTITTTIFGLISPRIDFEAAASCPSSGVVPTGFQHFRVFLNYFFFFFQCILKTSEIF